MHLPNYPRFLERLLQRARALRFYVITRRTLNNSRISDRISRQVYYAKSTCSPFYREFKCIRIQSGIANIFIKHVVSLTDLCFNFTCVHWIRLFIKILIPIYCLMHIKDYLSIRGWNKKLILYIFFFFIMEKGLKLIFSTCKFKYIFFLFSFILLITIYFSLGLLFLNMNTQCSRYAYAN